MRGGERGVERREGEREGEKMKGVKPVVITHIPLWRERFVVGGGSL